MSGNDYNWVPTFSLVALVTAVALIVGVAVGMGDQKLIYLAALVAIPLALKWPVEVALGAVALIIPFDAILVAVTSGSGNTTVTWFVSLGAGALLLGRIITGLRQPPPRVAMWWVLLIAWGSVTGFWAVDDSIVLHRLPTAWGLLIFYLAAVSSRISRKQLKIVLMLTVLGGCAAAIWASWSFFHGTFWGGNSSRASLSMDSHEMDPNFFAAMLLIPLSLSIGMFISSRRWLSKALLAVCAAAAMMAIILTMSRGALVAVVLLAGAYVFRLGLKMRAFAAVAVVLTLLAIVAPPTFWKRMQLDDRTASGTGRTNVWVVAAQMIKHHPLGGVGLSNFPAAYASYAGAAPHFEGYYKDSHNSYINILAEQGVVGLTLFLLAVFFTLRRLQGAIAALGAARAPAILLVSCEAALIAVLGSGFFLDLLFSKFVWFLLILCTLIARAENEQAAASARPANAKLSTVETVLSDPIFTR
jgi:O-antigen ligase